MEGNEKSKEIITIEDIEKKNLNDYASISLKTIIGSLPLVSGLSDLLTEFIPNQKIDRIIYFIKNLNERIDKLELNFEELNKNESFIDLIQETIEYVRKSKNKKIDYFIKIIENGLKSENIDFIEERKLAKILNELNEIEIIWLRYYFHPFPGGDNEFRTKHEEILEKVVLFTNADENEHKKFAMQELYIKNLINLNLLETVITKDIRTKEIKYDSNGHPKIDRYNVTILGKVLLKQIGLINNFDDFYE